MHRLYAHPTGPSLGFWTALILGTGRSSFALPNSGASPAEVGRLSSLTPDSLPVYAHWPIYNEAGHCLPRDKNPPVFGSAICKLLYRDGLLGKSSSSLNTRWTATSGGCVTDAVITALSCVQGTVTDGGSRRAQPKYEMRRDASPKSALRQARLGLLQALDRDGFFLVALGGRGGGNQDRRARGLWKTPQSLTSSYVRSRQR